jgi:hypothetical protein
MTNNIKFIICADIPDNTIFGISDKTDIEKIKTITGQYGLKVKSKISIMSTNNKQ